MRVRTSRMILLVPAAVFLGGMLLLALAGDAEANRQLPAQVAVWASIGLMCFAGWWFTVLPRRDLHRDQARSLGLRSAPGDPFGSLDRPFALVGRCVERPGGSTETWHGRWRRWSRSSIAFPPSSSRSSVRRAEPGQTDRLVFR